MLRLAERENTDPNNIICRWGMWTNAQHNRPMAAKYEAMIEPDAGNTTIKPVTAMKMKAVLAQSWRKYNLCRHQYAPYVSGPAEDKVRTEERKVLPEVEPFPDFGGARAKVRDVVTSHLSRLPKDVNDVLITNAPKIRGVAQLKAGLIFVH